MFSGSNARSGRSTRFCMWCPCRAGLTKPFSSQSLHNSPLTIPGLSLVPLSFCHGQPSPRSVVVCLWCFLGPHPHRPPTFGWRQREQMVGGALGNWELQVHWLCIMLLNVAFAVQQPNAIVVGAIENDDLPCLSVPVGDDRLGLVSESPSVHAAPYE